MVFLPRAIAIILFDKMILPILLYWSKVWGFYYSEICESVQYDFCRIITGLSTYSSKLVLFGEMGRYTLALHFFKMCIKYSLKTWATDIALLLTKFGFQHCWAQQGVENEDVVFEVLC